MSKMLFSPGLLMITPAAMTAAQTAKVNPIDLLHRHLNGDWGIAGKESNDDAVTRKGRIVSAYPVTEEVLILVITEYDRSATTILLAEEN